MISYDYYRIFYFVATTRSLTGAAKALGSNQPNITRAMNHLEQALGCKLLHRGNRGITLTQNGQALYEHVAIAFEQLENGQREILENVHLKTGRVTIAASENALRLVMLPELSLFKKTYPNINIQISNHSTPRALQALKSGLADFAVVTTPLDIEPPMELEPLYNFREIPIAGPGYLELKDKTLTLTDLQTYPMISVGRDTGTRELYIQYFLKHHLYFQPELEASSTDQLLPMVEYDLGIAFYPEMLAQDAIRRHQVVQLQLHEPLPERTFCLVTDHSRSLSSAAQTLIDNFRKVHSQQPMRI